MEKENPFKIWKYSTKEEKNRGKWLEEDKNSRVWREPDGPDANKTQLAVPTLLCSDLLWADRVYLLKHIPKSFIVEYIERSLLFTSGSAGSLHTRKNSKKVQILFDIES